MTAVAVVVSGWPRLSETFAVNEVTALASRGLLAGVFATKPGDASMIQPDAARLAPMVTLLDAGTPEAQGAEVAARLQAAGRPVAAVHGYFAHQPAEVAERAAAALGVPFSFSVHALDARKVDPAELQRRCRAAALVTTCNADTTDAIVRVGGRPVELPHGVDLSRFRPAPPPPDRRPVELLAVGRLVEKKGFVHLIEAMAGLGAEARLRIVGDGPLGPELQARIDQLGLTRTVELIGRRTHDELPFLYAQADAVVVPSVIDRAGDRDGLPNVVLEAMAAGRPVVATTVAAIPCAVVAHGGDDDTGLLVPPADPAALRLALRTLCLDPTRRHQLGGNGRQRAEVHFDLGRCSAAWVDLLARAHRLAEVTA